jgi:PGDYG protein
MLLFKSTASPGYSHLIASDPRHQVARKRERQVQVEFARQEGTVESQEGLVHVSVGDAILTGVHGERWRVSKARFAEKYHPAASTRIAEDGAYISAAIRVLALPMREPFEVLLADGLSTLRGADGDWLVDYGDGSLGIVSKAVFPCTYDIVS